MTGTFPKKLKILFELIVITFASYFLANCIFLVWFAAPITPPKAIASPTSNGKMTRKKERLADFKIIESRNLFNVLNTGAKNAVSDAIDNLDNLAVSKRGFKLLGTVFSDVPKNCRAIVMFEGKQSLYKLGDKIGGWEVIEIRRRAIVLAKGAEKEILLVDENDAKIASGSGGKVTRKVISRRYAQSQLGNLERLAGSVAVVPKKVDGTQGLLIQSIRKRSFLHDMGLQKNDLLVKANDQSFLSIGDITSLMSMLEDESISLEILRDGKRQTLTFKLMN